MSMTPRPNRRATALATLAFASAITGGAAGATTGTATAAQRGASPAPRAATARQQPASSQPVAGASQAQPPTEPDIDGLAAELGVHPGRLAAALRRIAPDESRSVHGLDPLTALAEELDLPAQTVYLAAARHAAAHPGDR